MPPERSPLPALRALVAGFPRAFWVLFGGTLVNRTGTFVVPFLAIYLTRVRGYSPAQAGMVAALWGAGVAIAGPVGGFLADRIGRRATLMLALGLGGSIMISIGFARSLAVIAPLTFLTAVLGEMYRPAMMAAIVDVVPPRDRARAIGLIYWVINLGVAIGFSLGGWLATISFTWLFVGDGATTLAFGFIVWRAVPESRVAHAAPVRHASVSGHLGEFLVAFRDPPFVGFLATNLVLAIVFMQQTTTMPLDMIAHGFSTAVYGAVIALNGVLIVLLQPFLGPWLGRHNPSRVLAAGTALVALGFGLNAVARTVPLYVLAVTLWTLGEIGALPVAGAVVADLSSVETRGRYQGAHGLSWGMAACLAPLIGTTVFQRFGAPSLWWGCLVVGLVVAAIHLAWAPAFTCIRETRLARAHAGTATPVG